MRRNDTHDGHSAARRWALLGFLAAAGFYLWTEHQAHVLGALPYLILAACPLMHLLHRGHDHHNHDNGEARKP
jgi:hypothetical protein